MKYLNLILLLAISSSTTVFASELRYRHRYLNEKQNLLDFEVRYFEIEREYEKGTQVTEEIVVDGTAVGFTFERGFGNGYQFGINTEYKVAGNYTEAFFQELSSLGRSKERSNGPREPRFIFLKKFEHDIGPHFFHSFKASYTPKLTTPRVTQHAEGRHILDFKYQFSYRKNHYEFAGEIFSTLFGNKESKRLQGGIEETESFTSVGLTLAPSYYFGRFSLMPLLRFANTTDFNTRNSDFERLSDKGFMYYASIGFQYTHKMYSIKLEAGGSSTVFNSIDEDVSRDIDYEIETKFIKLNTSILF